MREVLKRNIQCGEAMAELRRDVRCKFAVVKQLAIDPRHYAQTNARRFICLHHATIISCQGANNPGYAANAVFLQMK